MNVGKGVNLGLLIMRLGIGAAFIAHGWPKVTGGPEVWTGLGSAMGNLGIGFGHEFWGLMAAITEFGGGILLILGLFVRPASLLLLFVMAVATLMHVQNDAGFNIYAHPLKMAIVFLGLVFTGGGAYALSAKIGRLRDRWYS